MEAINKLNEESQKLLADRYDKEYATLQNFIQRAYYQGIKDGKAEAKSEMIELLQRRGDE
jgi:hypothetical protein